MNAATAYTAMVMRRVGAAVRITDHTAGWCTRNDTMSEKQEMGAYPGVVDAI